MKLSVSLFLEVNQLTFARTDNFSLVQIFERIPELRLKYIGAYPSDKVPQLTNSLMQSTTQLQAMIKENTGS